MGGLVSLLVGRLGGGLVGWWASRTTYALTMERHSDDFQH